MGGDAIASQGDSPLLPDPELDDTYTIARQLRRAAYLPFPALGAVAVLLMEPWWGGDRDFSDSLLVLGAVFLGAGLLTVPFVFIAIENARRYFAQCGRCRYDLRAGPSVGLRLRCPECGLEHRPGKSRKPIMLSWRDVAAFLQVLAAIVLVIAGIVSLTLALAAGHVRGWL